MDGVILLPDNLFYNTTAAGIIIVLRKNKPKEFAAGAVKDWIASKGMKTLCIEPGSPWENPYSESFNSRFRDEFLNMEAFGSKLEAKVLGGEHRDKYNQRMPHSSLEDLTLAEFAKRRLAPLRPFDFVEAASAPQDNVINPKHQPNLSWQVDQTLGALHR